MKNQQKIWSLGLTLCAAAVLTACSGGGGGATSTLSSTSYSDTPASTTYTTPVTTTTQGNAGTFTNSTDTSNKGVAKPSTQADAGAGAPGATTTLHYVAYDKNFTGGAPVDANAVNTISEASTFSVSTFVSPVAMVAIDAEDRDNNFATTSFGPNAGTQTPASPAPANGKAHAYGNVLSYCPAGGSTTSNDPLNLDQIVYFSENMVPVTAASELNGKTFTAFQCAEQGTTTITWVFDSSGGLTQNYGSTSKTFSSTQVAGMLSTSGLTIASISKTVYLRAYKFTNAAAATKYFIVDRITGTGARLSVGP